MEELRAPHPHSLRPVSTNDWQSWAIAFFLALGLWLWVRQYAPTVTVERDVPLQVIGSSEVAPASPIPDKVVLSVRGSEQDVNAYWRQNPQAKLDLTAAAPGLSQPFTIEVPTALLSGLTVVVDPNRLMVDLEDSGSYSFTPERQLSGELDPELSLDDPPEDLPLEVRVWGPATRARDVVRVVYAVNLDELEGSQQRKVQFRPVDASGSIVPYVDVVPADAEVRFRLRSKTDVRVVPIVLATTGTPKAGFMATETRIEPEYAEITGQPRVIGRIKHLTTEFVDLENVNASQRFTRVDLEVPEGVRVTPSTVTVFVTVQPLITRVRVPETPIELLKAPPGLQFTLTPPLVTLLIAGDITTIQERSPDEFRVTLDASRYPAGTYELTSADLIAQSPAGVSVFSYEPSTIRLEVIPLGPTPPEAPP